MGTKFISKGVEVNTTSQTANNIIYDDTHTVEDKIKEIEISGGDGIETITYEEFLNKTEEEIVSHKYIVTGCPEETTVAEINAKVEKVKKELNFPSFIETMWSESRGVIGFKDANNPTSLIMSGYSITNAPVTKGVMIITLPYAVKEYSSQICIQSDGGHKIWFRSCDNGTWCDWQELAIKNDLENVKQYTSVFSTKTAYNNYAAPFFIKTKQIPTIKSAFMYNNNEEIDIKDEVIISDYNENNFAVKCNNSLCSGSIIVVTFN